MASDEPYEQRLLNRLDDLLIVQLGLARIPQRNIRAIVGCGINRVSRILKHLPKKGTGEGG